jgi:hypothetical protein
LVLVSIEHDLGYSMRFIISVLLITIASVTFSPEGVAGCWEITNKDGKVSKVDEIWHLRNKLSDKSMLLVKTNGSDESVLVDSIRTITITPTRKGWLNFLESGAVNGEITFTDGSVRKFSSDLNLISRAGNEQTDIPFTSVQSIRRCEKSPLVADKPAVQQRDVVVAEASTQATHRPDVDVIYMDNGDVLSGTILTKELLWNASFATVLVKKRDIKHMTLIRENTIVGLIDLWSGDRVNGILETNQIKIKLSIGQTIDIKTDRIKAIRFAEPVR